MRLFIEQEGNGPIELASSNGVLFDGFPCIWVKNAKPGSWKESILKVIQNSKF